MTKCLLTIRICLGGLVLLAGCSGPRSAPQPPQVAQPIQPSEEPDSAVAPSTVAEPNEPAAVKPQETIEPNEPRPIEPGIPVTSAPDAAKSETTDNPKSEIHNPQSITAQFRTSNEPNVPPVTEPQVTDNPQSAIMSPQTPIWGRNPQSSASFIEGYADLLQSYVREGGVVDYANLHRQRLQVKRVLMELSEVDPNEYARWSDEKKLAFWINAYNLKMLDIITRNYPIQSSWWLRLTWPPSDIRHIQGIWTDYKFIVLGEEFTLAEVEQRLFHRTFKDPRGYLAIMYACWSGPALRRRPYGSENLSQQLDEQVKAFLASDQGLRIDRRAMVVRLSAVFKPAWRGKEFVARYGTDKKFKDRDPETRAVLSFIAGYLSREDAYFLETENYAIEYLSFDWRLNDTSRGY
ncbi:MAG: DUF547 domain-containing protein [Sedimentisphaerales bacterium]|nr:DUF547 domain-containing protein [Sedimentisphaerales bacterium]